jgi:hypothetical protein
MGIMYFIVIFDHKNGHKNKNIYEKNCFILPCFSFKWDTDQ